MGAENSPDCDKDLLIWAEEKIKTVMLNPVELKGTGVVGCCEFHEWIRWMT